MGPEKYSLFLSEVRKFISKDRIYTDPLRRLCWGTDAGFYRLIPKIVLRSETEAEVSSIVSAAKEFGVPLTFRAAGTSLSGQAISDSVLVVADKSWEKKSISEDRESVTLQPGVVGSEVNKYLAKYGRKFGPDPASIASCMVGGIVNNNASGMSCGTKYNSDATLLSARIVLSDGTILDTGDAASRRDFASSHPDFIKGIESIRDEILSDKELADRIKFKYSIKNVTGLNIYPFVRFTDPFDIIAHLMVGSEGTLGFISEVKMKTLPVSKFKASAMIYFPDIKTAASAVVAMRKVNVNAAELLDKRSLASVNDKVYEREKAKNPDTDLTAVLTEVVSDTEAGLDELIATIERDMAPFTKVPEGTAEGKPYHFTQDPTEYGKWWADRAGIFPSVGGMRKQGTTCLIEDVAFHIENLPEAAADLSAMLDRHGYTDSCIYGHALAGNFHFIINQSFDSKEEVARYESMIRDVAKIVVEKYGGSLKAEHGTGRNMAPFVKYEWGEKAYDIMKRVKALFDPDGILNPGVIFNDDPDCFLKNFKALPVLRPGVLFQNYSEAEGKAIDLSLIEAYGKINKCIECGFCEVNCLSCGFTLSSRTRIVARREIERLSAGGSAADLSLAKELEKEYLYLGNRTCAGDGMCSTSCPMGINVADLTHEIRRGNTPPKSAGYKAGVFAGEHFSGVKSALRGLLSLAGVGEAVLGDKAMSGVCQGLHKMGVPLWTPSMPQSFNADKVAKIPPVSSDLKVVYLPSCMNQMMGLPKHSKEKRPLVSEMRSLLEKAGYEVIFPEGMQSLCCGTIWESKGLPDEADRKTEEVHQALLKASDGGRYPVLCDQSPCLHRMRKKISDLKLYEPAEFIMTFLRDRLEFHKTDTPVAIHLTCSMREMKLTGVMLDLASLCSDRVFVPEGIGCCGFAGDKGMTNPELNAWSLRSLRRQLQEQGITEGYSNSRTCEIGLATNSGVQYVSIVYLVNRCTTAKS